MGIKKEKRKSAKPHFNRSTAKAVLAGAVALSAALGVCESKPITQATNSVVSNVSADATLLHNVWKGQLDIERYIPPKYAALIKNDATNRDLITAINQIQKAIASAQRDPATSEKQHQELSDLSDLLSLAKPIIQNKGSLPFSELSHAKAISDNREKYAAAAQSLYKDLQEQNPAIVSLASVIASNAAALSAIERIVPRVLSPSQARDFDNYLKKSIKIKPATSKKNPAVMINVASYLPAKEANLLKNNATDKDLLTAIQQLQSAVSSARKDPKTTPQQQQELASVAELLAVAEPIAQNQGGLPIADLPKAEDVFKNKQKYISAIRILYKGLQSGNPSMISLAKTIAANAQALSAIERIAPKVVSPAQARDFSKYLRNNKLASNPGSSPKA